MDENDELIHQVNLGYYKAGIWFIIAFIILIIIIGIDEIINHNGLDVLKYFK